MEKVTLDDVCKLFNDLLEKDPDCVKQLVTQRVRCNRDVADHPTVQVTNYEKDDKTFSVGILGVINGLFGMNENGDGMFGMEIDDDDNIVCFRPVNVEDSVVEFSAGKKHASTINFEFIKRVRNGNTDK